MLAGGFKSGVKKRFVSYFVSSLLYAAATVAQGQIPPQLLSEERADALRIDRETLTQRFGDELERCRVDPGEGYDQITCQLIEGMNDCFSGRREVGLATFQEALAVLEDDDLLGVVLVRVMMAEAERQMGHVEEAVGLYHHAISAVEALGRSKEPLIIESFTLFARLSGIPEPLLKQFHAMAGMMGPLLTSLIEAMVRDSFGTLLLAQGEPEKAEDQLTLALVRSRAILNLLDAQILGHLGQVQERQGELAEARTLFGQAISATERTGDLARRFGNLRRKAEVEIALGLPEEALGSLAAARMAAQKLGDLSRESRLLGDLVDFHYLRNDPGSAMAVATESLALANRSGDGWARVMARFQVGSLAMLSGAYESAARHLEAAVAILSQMESWRDEVTAMKINGLLHLSEIYYLLGRRQLMTERARAARALARTVDFPEADALGKVLEAWDRFLELAEAPERDSSEMRASLANLALVLRQSDVLTLRRLSGPLGRSIDQFSKLLEPRIETEGDALLEALDIGDVQSPSRFFNSGLPSALVEASVAVQEGRLEDAQRLMEKLLMDFQAVKNHDLEALVLAALASISWRSGEGDRAASLALEALDVLEGLVGGYQVDDLLMSYLGSDRRWLYDLAVVLLVRSGQHEQAFEIAERARSRALLHQLGNQRLRISGDARLSKLEGLRREILSLEQDRASAATLATKRAEYDELIIQAKLVDPEYANLVRVEPLDLRTLQREALPAETTLVSFYTVAESVFVWLVDQETLEVVTLKLSREEQRELVAFTERFALGSTRGADRVQEGESLRALEQVYFEKLISPILPHARHRNWILVPHRLLHYVPFAALRDTKGQRLAFMKTLSYAPSGNILRFLGDKVSPFEGRALVMGDPKTELVDLPWARREARGVAQLFGTEPVIGAEASESLLRQVGGTIDLLHVAAHGIYRPMTPRFSHLALAAGGGEDGSLEVEEIFGWLDLEGVDLVTLSACSTARGERTEGDEIIGLTRAFLYAGSPAVVSTLWQVDDRATSFLMTTFYEELKSGTPYAEALQKAQLETSRQLDWSDPYYWAAFTLTGDGRLSWKLTPEQKNVEEISDLP